MIKRRVSITVDETDHGSWRLTATLSQPFLRGKRVSWLASLTKTRTLTHPYAEHMTPGLLIEWVDAIGLVSAGYYEDVELPFD